MDLEFHLIVYIICSYWDYLFALPCSIITSVFIFQQELLNRIKSITSEHKMLQVSESNINEI